MAPRRGRSAAGAAALVVALSLAAWCGLRPLGDSTSGTGTAFFQFGPPNPSARASHILVKTEGEAKDLMEQLGPRPQLKEFGELASKHSTCPSGAKWGDLGTFEQGRMVPEFDGVIFNAEQPLETPLGPVQTKFGWHIIWIEERNDLMAS